MASRRFEPTTAQCMQVEIAAACGLPHARICERILNPLTGRPIDEKTLCRAFAQELERGAVTANAAVAQNLFKHATGGGTQAVSAAKFWLQCRAGWKPAEALTVAHSGAVGVTEVAQWLTPAQQEAIAREILRDAGYTFDD